MEVTAGNPCGNTERMLQHIAAAKSDNVELLVFPEMAVPGYLIGDEWEHEAFLRECETCSSELLHASKGLIVVFGNVGLDWKRRNEDGRVRKYNALFVAEDGVFLGPERGPYDFVVKTLLPNYREFDDSRHFSDLRKLAMEEECSLSDLISPVKTRGLSIGCAICEDAWDADYGFSPLKILQARKPDLFVNISCSPFTFNKRLKRHHVYQKHASDTRCPLVCVSNVGIQNNGKTVFTFDGSSCIYDGHGNVAQCGQAFKESCLTHDIPVSAPEAFGSPAQPTQDGIKDIHAAIEYGTVKFMELCGVDRITVGISGGIDSAVVAALYGRIVPKQNLLLVNMPGRFNSATTRALASRLAANLDCFYADIPIDDSVGLTVNQLDGLALRNAAGTTHETLKLNSFIIENIQARDRSSRILAAASAAFGGVFTCNANKSEATVGYTTLYGDLCGYLANIADLWKTEIYELAEYLNSTVYGREVIPSECITLTPSAELSEDQAVDKGKGDPLIYTYHDLLFKSWVEWWNRTTPEEILLWYSENQIEDKLGYEGKIRDLFKDNKSFIADLERWWNQYQGMGLVKRIQAPPVLAVKKRAFGFDHRESLMGPRYTREYLELKQKLLKQT
jgi:NAD+ synthase (glutamine-hydrolysing)